MKKVRVFTKPKGNTLDPQGVVVLSNLKKMGVEHIDDVTIGRYIELLVDENENKDVIKENVNKSLKLLHNDIIEDFEILWDI